MKIVIANGVNSADYLIKLFKKQKYKLVVINSSKENAEYISKENEIDVYVGDPSREYVLEDAGAKDANLFIALSRVDTDNYAACLLAKKAFNIDKCICSVLNPKNVDTFKELGLDIVISSTHLIGETIKNMISVSSLVNSLTFENSKIIMNELILKKEDFVVGKSLKELNFPETSTISCIFRRPNVIIPKGHSILKANDKIFLISSFKEQKQVINYIKKGK